MIYWSTRKKGLVFYFENQPKVWLTKEGWQSDNALSDKRDSCKAPSELIEECKLLLLEVKYFWLKRFSYSLVRNKVAAILAPYLTRFKESTNMAEKLNLAAWICSEGKNAVMKELSLTDAESALCLFFYKEESWKEFTSTFIK